MRAVSILAALAGLGLAACGDADPAAARLPAASTTTGSSVEPSPAKAPGTGEPYDPAAHLRPDLMTITPAVAAPGDDIELTFPQETERGVAYVLEFATGESWSTTHYLTSSTAGYDGTPSAVSVDAAEGYGWEDIGIGGPGPDRLVLPDDATVGASRICTANAIENFCAEITVVDTATPETTTPETTAEGTPVPIVAVHEDVDYYIACADVPVTVDGIRWYPVAEWGDEHTAEVFEHIMSVDREQPAGPVGFAPSVAPPGPGDDTGTLYVYADGYAWFESDSGLTIWLTQEQMTYSWIC